ncbi:MAG: response regulator [Chloroflexota bacterium]|nr:response regulator [Chloroflexota bacterium]
MIPVDSTATILVVDDDFDTREFLVLLVDDAGYHVVEAASGAAALAAVAAQPVHAIVLDLRLPDMDGLAVCRHLRADGYPDLPIILVTADQTPGLARRADEAGVTTMLAKPFAPEALLARLRLVLPEG